jgi:hypothetical protein
VHVPLEGFEDAEDPPSPAGFVFDVEVVAGLVVAGPPGAVDALGADGVDDTVVVAVVDEGDGGAVAVLGGADDDADLAGSRQEMERARGGFRGQGIGFRSGGLARRLYCRLRSFLNPDL